MQKNERFDHSVLNSLTAHVAVLDRGGGIVAVNDSWRRFGKQNRASESLVKGVGLNYLEVCRTAEGDESIQACLEGLTAVLAGAQSEFELEYPCHSPDEERWFLLRAVPLIEPGSGVVISHINVSKLKCVQNALRNSRERLALLLNSMPSVLIGVDLDGRVTDWNQEAEQFTGVPACHARGHHYSKLLPQLAPVAARVNESIRLCRPLRDERLVMEKHGGAIYVNAVIYPLLIDGSARGAVIRIEDVSEQVRIEQMLVHSEQMMSIGGFAAGMAHELNNPLGTIVQGSQSIMRRLSTELQANRHTARAHGITLGQVTGYLSDRKILDFLEGISEAALRASSIVSDMRAFTIRQPMDLVPAQLPEILDASVRLAGNDYDLKRQYDFEQIQIVRDYDPDLGAVRCNPTALRQVFLNIIKNAAQAMAEARPPFPQKITLRTVREGRWARVDLEDNGPGMDKSTRRRLFEPFFTTKPVGMGTGLGLSVSYFIITEQHGGRIEVTSRPGKGACFTIRLALLDG